MKDIIKENVWYIVAYVVFIALFWFFGNPHMSAATAYFALCLLHIVFGACVYIAKKII